MPSHRNVQRNTALAVLQSSLAGLRRGFGAKDSSLRRFLAFAILPAFGFASPLLVLPAITGSSYGAAGFTAIAVGQAAGTALAVPAELGWSLTGPRDVAVSGVATRHRLVCLSLGSRGLVFLPVAAGAVVISFYSAPQYEVVAAMSGVAFAASGLSLNWYFIGVGQPTNILLADAIPRLVAALVSAAVLRLGGALWAYPAILLFATLAGLSVGHFRAGARWSDWKALSLREHLSTIRTQFPNTVGRGFSAIYISLPILIVSWLAPLAAPLYAGVDRIVRTVNLILQAVPNALQSWMGAGHAARDLGRRAKLAILLNGAMGVIVGLAIILAGPIAAHFLFSGKIVPSAAMFLAASGIVVATCTSRATGSLALVHLDQVKWVNSSAVVATIISLPLVALGVYVEGATGALLGVLIAEVTVALIQIVGLARFRAADRGSIRMQ